MITVLVDYIKPAIYRGGVHRIELSPMAWEQIKTECGAPLGTVCGAHTLLFGVPVKVIDDKRDISVSVVTDEGTRTLFYMRNRTV